MSRRQFLEFLCVASVSLGLILFTRWRNKRELRQRRKKKKMGSINIGGIFGMDVGGTLTKIVYFERTSPPGSWQKEQEGVSPSPPKLKRACSIDNLNTPDHIAALNEIHKYVGESKSFAAMDESLNFYSSLLGGRMHFIRFETRLMMDAITNLSMTGATQNIRTIGCTGGGAHKYADAIADQLDIAVQQTDELECLVRGMHFAIMNIDGECYTYRNFGHIDGESGKLEWVKDVKEDVHKISIPVYSSSRMESQFPYLVVNIGSGVSILKVNNSDEFERVSGSSLGGGTYWGLCRLLTRCSSFEEAIDLAETGDSKQIDMLVRDIYGGSYTHMNLSGDMVASSFGKLVMKENARDDLKEEDLALALLMMITNNIGQVAYLNAKLHGCKKIYFVGSFLRHNSISCRRLAFAINFWSKTTMEALFLEHDGYFGAIGTFLQSAFGADVDKILQMSRSGDANESSKKSNTSGRLRSRSIDSANISKSCHDVKSARIMMEMNGSQSRTQEISDNPEMERNGEDDDREGLALRFVADIGNPQPVDAKGKAEKHRAYSTTTASKESQASINRTRVASVDHIRTTAKNACKNVTN